MGELLGGAHKPRGADLYMARRARSAAGPRSLRSPGVDIPLGRTRRSTHTRRFEATDRRAGGERGLPTGKTRAQRRSATVLVRRGSDPGAGEVLPQVPDFLPVEHVAVMRMVQNAFCAVQQHSNAGTGQLLNGCPEMVQEGLDLPPVDVAADGIVEDGADQLFVFVAHL